MIKIEDLSEKVFGLLKGFNYPVKMFTVDGDETVDPREATRFYSHNPGLMVTIDNEDEALHLSKSPDSSLESTKDVQTRLKNLANEYLLNYSVKEFNRKIEPKDFSYQAKIHRMREMGNVQEGFSRWSGSKKTSKQTLEDVKIMVKHRVPVDEEKRGARSRNIHSIFLEHNGERFRFPHNHLGGARAMARHVQQGGSVHDQVGTFVIEKTQQLMQLREFYKYARRSKLINEDSNEVIETIQENINSIKHELGRLAGSKTYESIKSRILETEVEELQEDNVDQLRDMFTVKTFNEKFNDVLPIVGRLLKEKESYLRRIEESASKDIFLDNKGFNLDSILEFASETARIGYNLSEMASLIVENPELAQYVDKIGKKLCQEQKLNAFESDIMRKVLSNAQIVPLSEEEKKSTELDVFESFFNKYDVVFI